MERKIIRAHVFILGRVQGVNYRAWTKKLAQGLEIAGWVRNIGDGRVETVFEGPKEKIEKIIQKCKSGPMLAGVKHMDVSWEKATGEFADFEILPNSKT